jgi:hypothetical protein
MRGQEGTSVDQSAAQGIQKIRPCHSGNEKFKEDEET